MNNEPNNTLNAAASILAASATRERQRNAEAAAVRNNQKAWHAAADAKTEAGSVKRIAAKAIEAANAGHMNDARLLAANASTGFYKILDCVNIATAALKAEKAAGRDIQTTGKHANEALNELARARDYSDNADDVITARSECNLLA